ncbi:NUDIX domain-containing protein [Bacillaceae bacterium S4-13-58]
MEGELLKVFDKNRNEIGVAPRSEVHQKGLWHETFHCWLVRKDPSGTEIFFQLRSKNKKDWPNLLDITAAGHLLADETVEDGIREVEEELGIPVHFQDLISLGVIQNQVTIGAFLDHEFCHVFLYEGNFKDEDFNLQEEEVSGMFQASFDEFCELWTGGRETLEVEGFVLDKEGVRLSESRVVSQDDFVSQESTYYPELIEKMTKIMGRQ